MKKLTIEVISMRKNLILIIMLILVFSLSACERPEDIEENVVYVTVYPMQFLVESIVGESVRVERVPGTNNHGDSIDWSAKEIIDMSDADLLFYVNGGADSYIPNNLETFEDGIVELVDLSETITYNMLCLSHDHEDEHTDEEHTEEPLTCDANSLSPDPHFWLDPVRMLQAARFVKDKLIATFPEEQELMNNNFNVLEASLEKLDEDYQAMADEAIKPIMTTVMLFTYWHVRYDIEILSITNDVHSSESNAGEIIEFVNHAIEDEIMFILFEKNANSPAGDSVLTELQTTVPEAAKLYIHGLGNLTTEEIENGATYISIMIDNLNVLKEATK
jgi:zinc transport system substrate-binding protein